jgi:hypothetical protein
MVLLLKESPVKVLQHDPSELFRCNFSGLAAPKIHGQLPGQRHQRPFLLTRGGLGI